MYFVEGLADGRVAVLSKSHQVLVDGVHTVDLGQVLLDVTEQPKELGGDAWRPRSSQRPLDLVAAAIRDSITAPTTVVDTVRSHGEAAVRTVEAATQRTGRVVGALTGRSPERETPVSGTLSQQRRIVVLRTDLADYRAVRQAHGGTVNDVILATVTGALRGWLMTRTESLGGLRQLRALVPVSVVDKELETTSLGSPIAAHFVDLPIGEASPVVRLAQVSYSFQAHKETGRGIAANRLAGIAGFAPTTFHAIGARVAAEEVRRGFQISVTNVPGPQSPLFAAGARMVETYPVHPLLPGHALAIGVTSYDGGVYYGITADRDLLPDADLLGPCLREALDELLDTATGARAKVPRGRKRASAKASAKAGSSKAGASKAGASKAGASKAAAPRVASSKADAPGSKK